MAIRDTVAVVISVLPNSLYLSLGALHKWKLVGHALNFLTYFLLKVLAHRHPHTCEGLARRNGSKAHKHQIANRLLFQVYSAKSCTRHSWASLLTANLFFFSRLYFVLLNCGCSTRQKETYKFWIINGNSIEACLELTPHASPGKLKE